MIFRDSAFADDAAKTDSGYSGTERLRERAELVGKVSLRMSRHKQLLERMIRGRSDASIRFDDLRGLLRNMGFTERARGSHHIFRREGVAERINLQRDDGYAKPYQVRQVRRVILKYKLEADE